MRFSPILLGLLGLPPLFGSCAVAAGAAAGAAAGYVISNEVLPSGVHTATVAADVDTVWATAKRELGSLSTKPLVVTESPRVAKGVVDGASVTVEVQAYDLDQTIVNVTAERYMTSRNAVAERVLDRMLDRVLDAPSTR
jgi:hypothetical protein